jgi:hypothetical protein
VQDLSLLVVELREAVVSRATNRTLAPLDRRRNMLRWWCQEINCTSSRLVCTTSRFRSPRLKTNQFREKNKGKTSKSCCS